MLSRTKLIGLAVGAVLTLLVLGFTGCSDDVDPIPDPPVAEFSASPTEGYLPLRVTFSNNSRGEIESCSWDFGNGVSTDCSSPVLTYTEPGRYSVTLTVKGPGGSDTETKSGYIDVEQGQSAEFSDARAVHTGSGYVTFTSDLEICGYKGSIFTVGAYWYVKKDDGKYYFIRSLCGETNVPDNYVGEQWHVNSIYDRSVFNDLTYTANVQCFVLNSYNTYYARMKLYNSSLLPIEPRAETLATSQFVEFVWPTTSTSLSGVDCPTIRVLGPEESEALEREIEGSEAII